MKSESKYETIPSEDIIERTAESLKANGIDVIITDNGVQARQKILEIMPKGANVMAMTSVTLNTVGVTKEIEESLWGVLITAYLNVPAFLITSKFIWEISPANRETFKRERISTMLATSPDTASDFANEPDVKINI